MARGANFELFQVAENVRCLQCGNKGAVRHYGKYFPVGLKDIVDDYTGDSKLFAEPYRNKAKMSYAVGFGGTIPYRCLNCGNTGLIDRGGLEMQKKAFETIKEED